MPLQKLQYRPGINKESTNYSNEGGFWACDKIRFRSGYPEKLGGWKNQSDNTFNGITYSLWNWVTRSGENLLGFGTTQKYYIENGGLYHDITPLRNTTPITLGTNPISATIGSKLVTVTATGHGATPGSFVRFQSTSTVTVGGLTIVEGTATTWTADGGPYLDTGPSWTADGDSAGSTSPWTADGKYAAPTTAYTEYEIVTVPDSNTFTIAFPVAASSTGTGGTGIQLTYLLNAGTTSSSFNDGWGTGAWSAGGWGLGSGTNGGITAPVVLWSQDNFEQDLILNRYGGPIYYWQKDTSTYPPAITLNSFANKTVKSTALAQAASAAGTSILYVDSTDGIDPGSVVTGTNILSDTYVVSLGGYVSATNSFAVNISAPIGGTGVSIGATLVFSYAGRAVPYETNFVLASDTSHFTIALGANAYDPTNFATSFDPLLVRWSDQDNPYEWTPRADNQSGEQSLSNGSYLVAAQNTRQEILIWSDAALFSMQYLGPPYVWGFNLLMDNISIASPNSMATVNSVTYWMGVDKFYMYSGRVETLPCTLRNFVFTNINRSRLSQIVCGTNEGYNEIWWHYPSVNSTANDSYIIYNHLERIWYYGTMNRTAWNDSPLRANPQAAFSMQPSYITPAASVSVDAWTADGYPVWTADGYGGWTADGYTTNSGSVAISNTTTIIPVLEIESYPNSGTIIIDDEKITYNGKSGNNLINCVRGVEGTTPAAHLAYSYIQYQVPNQIMFHEVGVDDAAIPNTPRPIAAYIESSDFDIGDGHQFGFVWRILPDLSFAGSTTTPPNCQVVLTVKARANSGTQYGHGDTPTVSSTLSYPISAELYTGEVFTRIRGRQMAFRMESTNLGVAWQFGSPRIDIRPDGRR